MNWATERIAGILGSAWVIIGFGLWVLIHAFIARDYVTTISDLAIEIGFLILRAESVQGRRMEASIKRTEIDTKKDLKKSDEVVKLVKEK